MSATSADWVGTRNATLARDGYRASARARRVVAALADLGCSVTAKEIADRLWPAARTWAASIYRALELLERLRLARRVDAGEGVARYEPVDPAATTTTISSATAAERWPRSRT